MASEKLFLRLFEVLEGQFLALKLQAVLIRNIFKYSNCQPSFQPHTTVEASAFECSWNDEIAIHYVCVN